MQTTDRRVSPPWLMLVLVAAGVWNIAGASVVLGMPDTVLRLVFPAMGDLTTPAAHFHVTSLWLFVGLVGAALLLGIRAPHEYRGVMLLSAVGRVAFAGLIMLYWLRQEVSLLMLLAAVGEGLLAAGLFWAYVQTGKDAG